MRLKDKVAIVVGAGQSPGEGVGNGRATALTFAREGAKVLCVDHHLESAQETVDLIAAEQGTAAAFKADVTKSADIKAMVSTRSVMCSFERCCLISAKVSSDMPMSRVISRAPLRIALASGSSLEGLPSVSANRPWMSSSVTPNSLPILT